MAGLSTTPHLAASLLALYAAAGLALVVVARPGLPAHTARRHRTADLVLAAGALAIAAGHGIAGALVLGSRDVVGGLHVGGLLLAVAGLLVGRRSSAAGRTRLVGAGLAVWILAEAVERASPVPATALTVVGAVLLGCWLWTACRRTLLARFVSAALLLLLGVVVIVATALSGIGSRDLVASELDRLAELSAGVAAEVRRDWLDEARTAVTVLVRTDPAVLDAARSGRLGALQESLLSGRGQQFLVVFDRNGRVVGRPAPAGRTAAAVAAAPATSRLATRVLGGDLASLAELAVVQGRLVALGAARLEAASPGGQPAGVAVSGRFADGRWARTASQRLGSAVVVVVAEAPTVTAGMSPAVAERAVAATSGTAARGEVVAAGRSYYAASTSISGGGAPDPLARMVVVGDAGALTRMEQDQARLLFLVAVAGAFLAAGVAALVTRQLVAPIRSLTAAAATVREGNLDVVVGPTSRDEMGELGRTFDEMTASLARQSAQLREAAGVQARLRARLEALTGSMSDGLVAVNPAGRVVTFNPAAQGLVGRRDVEVLGLHLDEVLVCADPQSGATAALGDPTTGETCRVTLMLRRSDERVLPVAVTAAPVHDAAGEQILGRVLVLRDISREAEVDRMKSELLANVSHELRTPLTPIKGYAEVLARRELDPAATRQFARQILSSTARLERVVAMIVDYAGLDSGSLRPHCEPVALDRLVAERVAHWRLEYPERHFRPALPGDLPPVDADRAMLRRCIDELLDNAVKFSPGGEPVEVVAAREDDGTGSRVRLSVRDRGVGVEREHLAQVFGDFYQADAGDTRRFGGLGLGLALVRRIVVELGGDVTVTSEPGRGSTFCLLLPVSGDGARGEPVARPAREDAA